MTTKIQWTDQTWNPIVGCSKISAGCQNCYAFSAANSARLQQFQQYQKVAKWDGTVELVESQLLKPLSWKKPQRIFVCSMSDLFHESIPFDWIDQIFAVMAIANHHTFQILTKRPGHIQEYLESEPEERILKVLENLDLKSNFLLIAQELAIKHFQHYLKKTASFQNFFPNVWLGTTVENQKTANSRIALLFDTMAQVRFLSCEPLLENLKLDLTGINWVIVGGESGTNARPCHLTWIRSLVNQCQASEVPVFVKQLGSNVIDSQGNKIKLKHPKGGNLDEFPADLQLREFPNPKNN
jgi:protein gp37